MNTQSDPKQILLETLEIIDYQKDKNAFAEEFMGVCQQEALALLLESLPENRRGQFAQDINGKEALTREKSQAIIKEYFHPEEISKALQKASKEQFQSFLETIVPTLSPEQKEKLQQYLASLKN